MSTPFESALTAITRQRGVTACLVAAEDDGIIVDATVRVGVDAQALAALVAALYRRARRAAAEAGLGEVGFLHLETERGHVCAVGREGLVLIALAESGSHIGLLRGAMLQSAEALA